MSIGCTNKEKYLKRFKDLYKSKNKVDLKDQQALELFEKLVTLVGATYPSKKHERRQ